ncbi:UNVERIFIED_ORG: hypothetical protein JN05_04062 [Zoogloea ramigera]|uniref:UDP-N-acetylmuramate--alanine ligase n=1 Tax=Duganella zoogloeoides TaxID=75659 RepID=A0ABZ0XVK2_9BURK|nr:hypothetical protein [Duganella zoogloeoides]WQH03777.1 hypothetical protein SR858_22425 [Duganella zoogloeoides]
MTPNVIDEVQLLRAEIAAAAARLIAEDGADYGTAKRKAARQIMGDRPPPANVLPDNVQIEAEVRVYQSLFHADTQPARLFRLRTLAVDIMDKLAQFNPFLTGAVLGGTAGPHDDIHLQLFADSAKEVEIFLLNRNVQIDISESPHFKGPRYDPVETVSFLWQQEGVHAELYELDDLRGAVKAKGDKVQRADIAAVRALLVNSTNSTHSSESNHE